MADIHRGDRRGGVATTFEDIKASDGYSSKTYYSIFGKFVLSRNVMVTYMYTIVPFEVVMHVSQNHVFVMESFNYGSDVIKYFMTCAQPPQYHNTCSMPTSWWPKRQISYLL